VEVPGEGGITMLVNAGQVRPADAAADNATVPVNPLTAVAVIVWVPEAPGASGPTVTAAEGAIVKSTTWNVITAVACVMVTPPTLLVPVTVTVKSPVAAALHDSVEVPGEGGITMLVNAGQVRPADAAPDKAIVPVNPFTAVAVMV
jgi:hypothetical protein